MITNDGMYELIKPRPWCTCDEDRCHGNECDACVDFNVRCPNEVPPGD